MKPQTVRGLIVTWREGREVMEAHVLPEGCRGDDWSLRRLKDLVAREVPGLIRAREFTAAVWSLADRGRREVI